MNKTVTLEHSEVGFKSSFPLERQNAIHHAMLNCVPLYWSDFC